MTYPHQNYPTDKNINIRPEKDTRIHHVSSKENGLICKAKDPFYSQTFFPVSNDSLSKYLLNIMGNIAILR